MRREIEGPVKPIQKIDGGVLFQESLENRSVRRYVGMLQDVMTLRKQFESEAKQAPLPVLSEFPASVAFERAEVILGTEELMLKHGFDGNNHMKIDNTINNAVRGYGMTILSLDGVVLGDDEPEGEWKSALVTEATARDRIPPDERKDEFHMRRVREEGERLVFQEDSLWPTHHHTFLTMVVDMQTLLNRQKLAAKMPEEPGLAPSMEDRVRSVLHLTNAAVMALEESVEEPLDLDAYTKELNAGLAVYGTRVAPITGRATLKRDLE